LNPSPLVTSSNVVFGPFLQNTILQTGISNFGRKMRAIGGGKFPLEYPFAKEYSLIVLLPIAK
jgi:hypothetical protein